MSAIDDLQARTGNRGRTGYRTFAGNRAGAWRRGHFSSLETPVNPHTLANRGADWELAVEHATTHADSGTPWARRYRRWLRWTDTAIIVTTVTAAYLIRFDRDAALLSGTLSRASYAAISLMILLLWVVALEIYHTRDDKVLGIGADEYKRVLDATIRVFGCVAILMIVMDVEIVRSYFALTLPAGALLLLLNRWQWRAWLNRQRHYGHYLSKVIVVGEQADVEYVVRQFGKVSGAAYEVIGAALPAPQPGSQLDIRGKRIPVLCSVDAEEVAEMVRRTGANSVVVAGSLPGGTRSIRELGWTLECTNAGLVLASNLTNVAGPRIHWRPVEGLPLMHVELPQFSGAKHTLKRVLDVAVASASLLLLAPLMVLIAWIVARDSAGPVFFRQERIGRDGERFMMLKFRSMVVTAEQDLLALADRNEGAGPLFKMKDDPRVTRCGRWLRKYSLDELPQLWNVLRGDMSLVGPRPPLASEVEGYENDVRRRLLIKPGITGLWQVNGRSNLDWDESVRLDLYYVENWSLTGDIMILWRTAKVVLHPVGAY